MGRRGSGRKGKRSTVQWWWPAVPLLVLFPTGNTEMERLVVGGGWWVALAAAIVEYSCDADSQSGLASYYYSTTTSSDSDRGGKYSYQKEQKSHHPKTPVHPHHAFSLSFFLSFNTAVLLAMTAHTHGQTPQLNIYYSRPEIKDLYSLLYTPQPNHPPPAHSPSPIGHNKKPSHPPPSE